MAIIDITLPHHHYDVRIEPGSLNCLGELLGGVPQSRKAAIFVDGSISDSCGATGISAMQRVNYDVLVHVLDGGESHKHLDTVRGLYEVLVEARWERRCPVIAMGGGVVGDTVGFVAATYLRGVPLIQCPTTLLAMVDASLGGKVGVNLPQGKNLVGCFYQPALVVIDTDSLTTLPPRQLRCGLAECVKHAMIRDADLFAWIESRLEAIVGLQTPALVELVERNVRIKAELVMADEKESGVRAQLNFGHTFAHAIEATQGYAGQHQHGEAVAMGMVAATHLAVASGRCDGQVLERLVRLLERIGLPVRADDLTSSDRLVESMQLDKKVADGQLRLVLPDRLGSVSLVQGITTASLKRAWSAVGG